MATDTVSQAGTPVHAAGPSSTTTSDGAGRAARLDYDAFLKLLVAEMSNQDPTEPLKSADYMAQLASFSGVEQAIQTNAKLDQLLASSAFSQAASVVGRTVTSADGAITGVVEAVRLGGSRPVAILTTRQEVPIVPGVTVS